MQTVGRQDRRSEGARKEAIAALLSVRRRVLYRQPLPRLASSFWGLSTHRFPSPVRPLRQEIVVSSALSRINLRMGQQ